MAPNSSLRERLDPAVAEDPRQSEGAQVIDLATRNVLPQVSQRKKGDGLGLAAGVLIVAALGGVTLWSMDAARKGSGEQSAAPASPAENPLPASAAVPQAAQTQAPAVPAPAAPAPQPVLAAPPAADAAAAPASNPYASPTVVFDASSGTVAPPAGAGSDAKGAGNANDDFAARIGGSGSTASAARSFDPATTVTQGTLIPAVLEDGA